MGRAVGYQHPARMAVPTALRALLAVVAVYSSTVGSPAQEPVPAAPPAPRPAAPATPQGQEPEVVIPVDQEAEQRGQQVMELTVEQALRLGRVNNIELRAAELVPAQVSTDLLSAQAIFQPELYGDLGYTESQSPQRNLFQPSVERKTLDATIGWRQRVVTGGLFDLAYSPTSLKQISSSNAFPDQQYSSVWSISYTQPLLRGAWTDYNLARIRAATHELRRSEQQFERQVQDTLLAIVDAYWNLAFSRENYRVVLAALAVAREQLRITQERIRVRELAPRDRIADEAEVARRQEELIVADYDIRAQQDSLRRLLFDDQRGQLWRQNLRPVSPIAIIPEATELPWQEYADAAIQDRPDLKALRNDVAAAEQDLLEAERDQLPGLDLVGGYSSDGVRDQFSDAWADSIEQRFPDWSLRLQFSIPVGNQAAKARRQRAELEFERRRRVLYGAMMDVTQEVREAVRQLAALAQSIHASGESVRLAESNLETEQVKLRVGASTAFEVQRRNQELREARSRHLRNQLNYRVAESRLLHARGVLRLP
jgi:outer membrane protein TolC